MEGLERGGGAPDMSDMFGGIFGGMGGMGGRRQQ